MARIIAFNALSFSLTMGYNSTSTSLMQPSTSTHRKRYWQHDCRILNPQVEWLFTAKGKAMTKIGNCSVKQVSKSANFDAEYYLVTIQVLPTDSVSAENEPPASYDATVRISIDDPEESLDSVVKRAKQQLASDAHALCAFLQNGVLTEK